MEREQRLALGDGRSMNLKDFGRKAGKELVFGGLFVGAGLVVWEFTKNPLFAILAAAGPILFRRIWENKIEDAGERVEVKQIRN